VRRARQDTRRRTFWDYNERGLLFYGRGDYDLAIAELRRAVGAAAFPIAVLDVNLGAAYLANGMYQQARSWLEEGVRTDPNNQTGHVLLGRALVAMGETAAAWTAFHHASELNPDSPGGRAAEEELGRLYGLPRT
jgi:tetratricopeptide (TPR) repeat protein